MTAMAQNDTKALTYQDVITQVAAGDMTLIDVRDMNEVSQTGKAKGAEHIPLMMLATKADPNHPEFHNGLYTNKPVAVYCAAGGRAGMAVNILNQLGYETTLNIGGFDHWVQAGGPVEK